MFQFFKRTGQTQLTGSSVLQKSSEPRNFDCKNENPSFPTLEDDDCAVIDSETQQSSRLSKTLSEVLADKNAQSYFIQFLEHHDALKYIKCYLDIQYFRSLSDSDPDTRLTSLKLPDHDSLSLSTDCDSFTADSNSLFEYSMDICDISNKINKLDVKDSKKGGVSDSETKNSDVSDRTDLALRIFKKYIALESVYFILCPDGLRNEIIENICTENGVLDSNCFDNIQNYCFEVLNEKYYNLFLRSNYNCKYQIDVLTSGNLNLQDILYNEAILFYFIEFLEQERLGALLEFWLAAMTFRAGLGDNFDKTQAENDAIVLYDKYFSLQATCPLGFSDKLRFTIEENICHENGIYPTCFATPVKLIENYLEKHYLKQFVSSQLYFKYLSELINTVQTYGLRNRVHNRTHSDGSSDYSNTLLADSNFPKPKSKKHDMCIDTRQLYDPDSLWRRRKARLSFGRITNLGRFETDVEPNPARRGESRITKVVKKLINVEENKSKEEMAWQIAEMIVKDVTNVTLKDVNPKT